MTSHHLLLLVAMTSGLVALSTVRTRTFSWGAVAGVFVIASVVLYIVAPDQGGYWLLPPFAVLVLAPLTAIAQLNRALAARRLRAARVLAQIASTLHPFGAYRGLVQLTRAWQLAADGKLDDAEALLQATAGIARDDCLLEIHRLRNRWDAVNQQLAARGREALGPHSVLRVRALGEVGELDRMLQLYRRIEEEWAHRGEAESDLATARLFAAAFLGRVELVDLLCDGPLRHYSDAIKQFWRATALAASGRHDDANAIWSALAREPDWRMRQAAEYRQSRPPAIAGSRGDEIATSLADTLREAATYGDAAHASSRPARISVAAAACLVIVQLAVVYWENAQQLYDDGMFWSTGVLEDGEWWRVVTAMFLHAGWVHVVLNVVAIVWFGPFVERSLGWLRFALVMLLGGVAGFALLTALDAAGLREPNAALGASGAAMALIGASIAIFLRGSIQDRSRLASSRLRTMLGFLAVQVVFDVLAPQVSMTGHLAGLAVGFLIGLTRRRA